MFVSSFTSCKKQIESLWEERHPLVGIS